jgi:hypothetical protein
VVFVDDILVFVDGILVFVNGILVLDDGKVCGVCCVQNCILYTSFRILCSHWHTCI